MKRSGVENKHWENKLMGDGTNDKEDGEEHGKEGVVIEASVMSAGWNEAKDILVLSGGDRGTTGK